MNAANGLANSSGILLSELFHCGHLRTVPPVSKLPAIAVTSVESDSRSVRPGSCFVAVRGTDVDGHEFLPQAVASGATVVVVEQDASVPSGVEVVRVDDTRTALAHLASNFYGIGTASVSTPRIIGVTGTNGKTTVSWMARAILKAAGQVPALLGTVEYDLIARKRSAALTTPGPLQLCRYLSEAKAAGATDAVLEVSSHALAQRRCDGIRFCAGVFTNISGDHLDYHGDHESYCAAKRRLFTLLDADGVAVINGDDPESDFMKAGIAARCVTFGLDSDNVDAKGAIESMTRRESVFEVDDVRIRLQLVGRHNVSNALAAFTLCRALGVDVDAIRHGLERFAGVPGRAQRVESGGWPFSVFVDYAHTDDALRSVLQALRPVTDGRLICVFGCGGDRDRSKRPRMAAVVAELADVAHVTSDNPRTEDPSRIIDDILAGFDPSATIIVEAEVDRGLAIQRAIHSARAGDTVLIAGKGHETYQLVGTEVLDFDDVGVAREALAALPVGGQVA